jgi:hypothetical protein
MDNQKYENFRKKILESLRHFKNDAEYTKGFIAFNENLTRDHGRHWISDASMEAAREYLQELAETGH